MRVLVDRFGWKPLDTAPFDQDVTLMVSDGRGTTYALKSPFRLTVAGWVSVVDAGATFAEGHELGSELVVLVAPAQIGRLLSGKEAEKLLARFEGRKPRRSKK
jgi:hypothetical protein